jgi:hypothetical protein
MASSTHPDLLKSAVEAPNAGWFMPYELALGSSSGTLFESCSIAPTEAATVDNDVLMSPIPGVPRIDDCALTRPWTELTVNEEFFGGGPSFFAIAQTDHFPIYRATTGCANLCSSTAPDGGADTSRVHLAPEIDTRFLIPGLAFVLGILAIAKDRSSRVATAMPTKGPANSRPRSKFSR